MVRHLGSLVDQLVFVGGTATGLLITDSTAGPVRPTADVDAIANVLSYVEFVALEERLRRLGFQGERGHGAPICRWTLEGLRLDVMPVENILGFTNRWYKQAFATAVA